MCTPAARRGGSLNVAAQRPSRYRFVCTPAARRGGSLNSEWARRQPDLPEVHPGSPPGWESQRRGVKGRIDPGRAPRQPAGVGVSTSPTTTVRCPVGCTPAARRGGSLNMGPDPEEGDAPEVHPGSPPGWESQLDQLDRLVTRAAVHPGSPPGWESQRAQWSQLCPICGGAPRQPAGVGVSTNPAMVRIGLRGVVHPGSPPGWESQLRFGVVGVVGGRVHPGSPPGWESQRLRIVAADSPRRGAPRQPAGVGVSTAVARAWLSPSSWCTPAARRGGSLNPSPLCPPALPRIVHPGSPPGWESQPARRAHAARPVDRAPRQPAGVGVSTEARHPAGQGAHRAPRQPAGVGVSTPARTGFGHTAACAPRQPAGVGVSTPRPGWWRWRFRVHPGSPPGWESQRLDPTPGDGRQNRAPRQPAGVGVSTCCRRCASRPTNRAPRQPAGVGVSTPSADRHRPRMRRAPRQPAGVGVSTRCWPGIARLRIRVHPGSPPGWESQPRHRRRAGSVRHRAPRQPAGVGVSTSSSPSRRNRRTWCTPAARRGGSLNTLQLLSVVVLLERAPRQPAGVGVSTARAGR